MRAKIFLVGLQDISMLAVTCGPTTITIEGAPPDSKIASCYYVKDLKCFALCLTHPSFEDVGQGEKLPELRPLIKTLPLTQNFISMN